MELETKYRLRCDCCSFENTWSEGLATRSADGHNLGRSASDNLALDGWMGLRDAAAADTGEPHASREAARVRTGWRTRHMADTSARLTQSTPTQPLIVPPLLVS